MLAAAPAQAQEKQRIDRKEWFEELRRYKHDFLSEQLKLTKEQQEKFFPMYDEMENSIEKVNREARGMEHKIMKAKGNVSDLEYEKAAEAMYEAKGKEAAIERQYFTKFKTVLTPRQLFGLKCAERMFMHKLMKEHSKARAAKK